MVSKKILGVAIAAAFSSQAFAVIDLNATTGAQTYAKESITNAQITSGLVQTTAAGTELNVQVKAGSGVSVGGHAYIRFDLTNAKFKNIVVPADLTDVTTPAHIVAANTVVQQGGAIGDAYVIFDVTSAGTGIAQADVLQLALAGLQVSPSAAASVAYAIYDTPSAAVNQTAANKLASASYASAVSVANVLKTDIVASDRVADVNASPVFTTFVNPASATAALGTVKFSLGTAGAIDAAGLTITNLNQLIDNTAGKSSLTVSGDLTFIAGANAAATSANLTFGGVAADVATPGTNTVSTGKLTTLTNGAFALGNTSNVSLTATSAINVGSYSLTAAFTGITNAAYAPAAVSAALGSITRSGTTVQVPYLTTFGDYNQRLVLVNRGTTAVPYTISFTTEAGVTAAAGTAATGTLAAGKTVVLKAADVVTLTGGSRTAATVVVTAPSTTIDAATTTVNLSDKSTDTVKLN